MRRLFLLLCAIAISLPATLLAGGGGDDDKSEPETLRRSQFDLGSYPGGPVAKSPLATGYYVTDNDAPQSGAPWAPTYSVIDTTGADANGWRRIRSGPRQGATVTSFGHEYFRNPNDVADTTNEAFAGPITIGFPFYYYGRKYDSFYVSTNGLVALANRRYLYNLGGDRIGYDPSSDDIRPRTGDAITDPTPDDYGYQYVALNNGTAKTSGILNPANTPFPNAALRSVLAPLWDDTELSQVEPNTGLPDDFGRAYWRLDQTGTKLIIYFVKMSMVGIKNIPPLGITARVAPREIRASFQVVLNKSDSSVQYNYKEFLGNFVDPNQGIFNIPSAAMFRANATIGVQSHDYEFTNYLYNDQFQGTVYVNGDPGSTPHPGLAINFKQWKNIIRVLEVSFQRPNPDNPSEFVSLSKRELPDNFELLLGHPILGIMRPVGIVENVSSDVGPVNITPQPVELNVVFRIRDLVNKQDPPVYQKTRTTKKLWPIDNAPGENNNNVNKPNKDTIIFETYNTNAQRQQQLGRFLAEIEATDRSPLGISYGDLWPFDNKTGVRLFGISRQELPYVTTFSNYSVSEDGVIPDVKRWVSVGGEVVDGDAATYSPPPPRGASGPLNYNSPVAKLDRKDIGGAFYNRDIIGVVGGDTLISFPINLTTAQGRPVIVLSYQRSGRQLYPRGWSDNIRVGPEQAVYNTLKSGYYQLPDRMVVEFAEPSTDEARIDNVTNPKRWRDKNFNDKEGILHWGQIGISNDSPRWGVFGGGGGSASDTTGKLNVNEFDGGKDFEFNRAYIPIPARWTGDLEVAKLFRFRIRIEAKSDKNPIGPPADDEDAFYVDNILVVDPDKPEVEVTAVGVDWPYTEAPASQARAIPLWAKVSNNGTTAATAFGVAMYVENMNAPPPPGDFSYYRYLTILSLGAGRDMIQEFPSWNAQECGTRITVNANTGPTATRYRISGQILPTGYDSYNANDVNFTEFNLTLGATFAYDPNPPTANIRNDVAQFAGLTGKGLNLVAPFPDANGAQPYGPSGGSSSGTFAMQFRILSRDTIRGFQAFYAEANQSPDFIRYALYKQAPGTRLDVPPQLTGLQQSTRTFARRGEGKPTDPFLSGGPFYFGQYIVYELDTPYVADPGTYFATVAQLGQTGLELGGSAFRQGQVITVYDPVGGGAGNYHVPAHPEMRQNRFWFESTSESGGWNPMLTTVGNPGYPHLNIAGQNPTGFPTWQRGSWIPFIRPYFGYKESGNCLVKPVELASFEATPLTSAIRLDWQTATELNNNGFYVERSMEGQNGWNQLTFAKGMGTSNQAHDYSFVDNDVVSNVTYQYRLRQEDFDGSINYSGVREARISSATTGSVANVLSQNMPNPVNSFTEIPFVVAENGVVSVEICDVYGSVVRTFAVDARAGVENRVEWDVKDASGVSVANGTYIYKLIGDGFTQSRKMTVIR